jgi:hypothetical protein
MADITGRSFIATLLSTTGSKVYPVGFLYDNSLDGNGWLIQHKNPRKAVALRFDFIEAVGNRLHYHISGAPGTTYAGAKVGVSRNGYLGFYSIASVTDYWKIELGPDEPEPDLAQFILRDCRGYRVGALAESVGGFWTGVKPVTCSEIVHYLNVESADTLYFQARLLEML